MTAIKTEDLKFQPDEIDLLKRAFKTAFGREGEFRYEEHYPDVVEIDGIVAISVGRAKVERESITGKTVHKEKRWFVEGMKWYPATRWEPEDVDMYPISDHENLGQAVNAAFTAALHHHIDAFFEGLYYEQLAKEMKEEQVWT